MTHMWVNVWVALNCVIPLNTCHPECFRDVMIKCDTNPRLLLLGYSILTSDYSNDNIRPHHPAQSYPFPWGGILAPI